MKAALTKPGGKIGVEDIPVPEPGPGEVLVDVAYCGICGSDLHMIEFGVLPPGKQMGHELSGTVSKPGEGVTGWAVGDRVVVYPAFPCMDCDTCRAGYSNICEKGLDISYGLGKNGGGFGEYMRVKDVSLIKIPDSLDLKTAALAEPLAVAVHGVNMLDVNIGEGGLVLGAGPIGLFAIMALRMSGATTIIVSEPNEHRRIHADEAGADIVVNPYEKDCFQVFRDAAGHMPDFVLDAAGTAESLQAATSWTRPRGRALILGVHMGIANITPILCITKEIRVIFSFGYSRREFADSVKMLDRGAVNSELVVSAVMPLVEIDKAFDVLKSPKHSKILVDCG